MPPEVQPGAIPGRVNMKRLILYPAFALALAGCLPQPSTPVDVDDLVATNVAATLALLPTASPAPPTAPPLTVESPGPTSPPTATQPATIAAATSTATASPTLPSTNTPTLVSGDPREALGSPTWRDTFADGRAWSLGEDSFSEAEVQDGKFILTGLSTIDGWRVTGPGAKDIYLEATIATGECTGNDHYGLIFRVPDFHDASQGYLLGFTCDGRYWLRSWDGEEMETLVPLTTSAAINSGSHETNRIGVKTEGDELTLYANGTLLREIVDDTWNERSGFGYFIGARQTEDFTIESDEIAYWEID